MLNTIKFFSSSFILANVVLFGSQSHSLAQILPPPPPASESSAQGNDVYQFQAPTNTPSPSPRQNNPTPSNKNTLFRVQVYGNSEQLLSLVRRVEPNAFVRDGQAVIQAGLFSDAVNAIQLVQSLSEQGIEADIIKITKSQSHSSRSPREFIALSDLSQPNQDVEAISNSASEEVIPLTVEPPTSEVEHNQKSSRSYYVVIPTQKKKVSQMAQAVRQAGINPSLIQERNAPRGTHVAVGPFDHRAEASRWSHQLQTQGMNARVYFGR